LSARCFGEDVEETLASVGERAQIELPVAMPAAQRAGGKIAGRRCRQGALEFVKSNEDAHPLRLRILGRVEKT
jgi:hypothetical protein